MTGASLLALPGRFTPMADVKKRIKDATTTLTFDQFLASYLLGDSVDNGTGKILGQTIVDNILPPTPSPTEYGTWYLDPVNGLDTNSGLSRSAPKKTGDAVVIACKTAGKTADRLVVMAGTGVGTDAVTFTAANWADA